MLYILTGVQHTKSGDIVMGSFEYENQDGYKKKYHDEMSYAMNNQDFLGLGIKVFDKATLNDVLVDNWVREVEE